MTLTPEALEEIKARAANADGLFTANGRNAEDVTETASINTLVSLGDEEGYIWVQVTENGGGETALDNVVAFIERGPSDCLALIKALEEREAEIERLQRYVDCAVHLGLAQRVVGEALDPHHLHEALRIAADMIDENDEAQFAEDEARAAMDGGA